ncbi:MAG: phage minor tail protein L [Sphaerospermopsis kisseleviana]
MSLITNSQKLDTEVFIDLINIKNTGFDIKICNHGSVSFGGVAYQGFPCKISSFSKSGESTEARASLTVSDISGLVGDIVDNYSVIGSDVIVKRTQPMFLDGKPTADATQFYELTLKINQYTGEYQNQFIFALTPYSLERKKLPARIYSRRCQWQLSDQNCQAPTNIHFDIFGNPTTAANRACRKDLDACKQYHGNTLRFGGFPSVNRIRS